MVIGYATEAHLFIQDLNQSPFNIGCSIALPNFTLENTLDLNERYGRPVTKRQDIEDLQSLVGGQPLLTRRVFDAVARGRTDIATILATADSDDGLFDDHLKRVLISVSQLPVVWAALAQSLESPNLPDSQGLQKLVAAGILARKSGGGHVLPCALYQRYLARYVKGAA